MINPFVFFLCYWLICIIVDVTLSSDFMTGFCGETEEEHADTISLIKLVGFDMAYMFAYSMRKVCNSDWNARMFVNCGFRKHMRIIK